MKKIFALVRKPVSQTWIVNTFNKYMIPEDIAATHPDNSNVATLPKLKATKRGVTFFSGKAIKDYVSSGKAKTDGVNFVMWDLEKSSDASTPHDEILTNGQIDLPKIKQLAGEIQIVCRNAGIEFVNDAGFPFNRWPGGGISGNVDYVKELSPFFDWYKCQGMAKMKDGPTVFKNFYAETVKRAKSGNPALNFFIAQVTTTKEYYKTWTNMMNCVNAALEIPEIAGISTWYQNTTEAKALVDKLFNWFNQNKR